MRKKLQKKAVTLASNLVKHIGLNTILPFTEKPSTESDLPVTGPASSEATGEPKKLLAASDLFSLFTADIIKKDVTFTR